MSTPYSYAWTAAFTPPAALANLVLDTDDDLIAITAAWDASLDSHHYEYLIEAQWGDNEWVVVGRATDTSFIYYLSPENIPVRIRVSDSNGSQYGATVEDEETLDFEHWALVTTDGSIIETLENDLFGTKIDLPLDQRSDQPLSGPDGDTSLPIVYTGQWQGERITATFYIFAIHSTLIKNLQRAALLPQGTVALKDPDGGVYLVALGGISLQDMGNGDRQVAISATRIA